MKLQVVARDVLGVLWDQDKEKIICAFGSPFVASKAPTNARESVNGVVQYLK